MHLERLTTGGGVVTIFEKCANNFASRTKKHHADSPKQNGLVERVLRVIQNG